MIFVALYVDDLGLASNNTELIEFTKDALIEHFEIMDICGLQQFIGMEVIMIF